MIHSFYRFLLLLLTFPSLLMAQQQDLSYNIATYNIRYDARQDTVNAWKNRAPVIQGLVLFNEIDIFGIQEGLYHQVEDLDSLLPNHTYIGVGRDDGAQKGEYSAIFYDEREFEVLESETFWLSETPDKPSKSWDASLPRICTWAVLKHKQSNAAMFIFNAHFDHIGKVARVNSASLIHKKIKEIAKNNPVVLMGDFNAEPGSKVYATLGSNDFNDAFNISQTPHFGPEASFNGFNFAEVPTRRIDFIFVNNYFTVLRHAILNNHYGLKYPSDHFPVVAEIKFAVD